MDALIRPPKPGSIQEARDQVAGAKLALLEIPPASSELTRLIDSITRHPYQATVLGLAAGLALSSATVTRGALKLASFAAGKAAARAVARRLLGGR